MVSDCSVLEVSASASIKGLGNSIHHSSSITRFSSPEVTINPEQERWPYGDKFSTVQRCSHLDLQIIIRQSMYSRAS